MSRYVSSASSLLRERGFRALLASMPRQKQSPRNTLASKPLSAFKKLSFEQNTRLFHQAAQLIERGFDVEQAVEVARLRAGAGQGFGRCGRPATADSSCGPLCGPGSQWPRPRSWSAYGCRRVGHWTIRAVGDVPVRSSPIFFKLLSFRH